MSEFIEYYSNEIFSDSQITDLMLELHGWDESTLKTIMMQIISYINWFFLLM